MPIAGQQQQKKDGRAADAKPKRFRKHFRLKRWGKHDEQGLSQFYLDGTNYRRERVYSTSEKDKWDAIRRTGKFEEVEADDLEDVRRRTAESRMRNLNDVARERRENRRASTSPRARVVDDHGGDDPAAPGMVEV